MGRQKITIGPNDFLAWGKLVKTWATGRNYVEHEMTEPNPVPTADELAPNFPKPRSFGEFWDQCGRAGVGLVFDDGKNTPVPRNDGIGLIVIQADADAYVLRLPPEEILLDHEGRFIAAEGAYKLPPFYSRIFGGSSNPTLPPNAGEVDTKVKRMKIHAERVGEYTLNTCG
jgi:hypothetical protein